MHIIARQEARLMIVKYGVEIFVYVGSVWNAIIVVSHVNYV